MAVNIADDHMKVVKSVCDRCHGTCGVLAYVKDGRVVKVEGDPDFPQNEGFMCPKGLAVTQVLYHPDRIKYPMKRIGERGEGKWERISWDEALDTAASRFKEVMEKWGPESITWSWGDHAFHDHRVIFKLAWLHAMGSPTHFHSDAHYCYYPTGIANIATFGEGLTSEVGPEYRNSRCIMLCGGNPVMSHPTRARALGILHVIINEELYDKEFVDKWCIGFPELRERVQEYPPDRVSEISWVPQEEIIAAARMYAAYSPGAAMHTRMGVQQNFKTHQTCRAICIIAAICGNLDVKGGLVLGSSYQGFKNSVRVELEDMAFPPEVADRRIGAEDYPFFSGSKSLVGGFCHPPSVIHAILKGKPHPVKAIWALNDLLLCLEGAKETKEALKKLDFFAGSDFFMTPTMEMCDIIMPPHTYLEKEGIEDLMYNNLIAAKEKVIEPVYDTMDDREMDLEIMKRMGLEFPKQWKTVAEYHDYVLSELGIKFEELKKRQFLVQTPRYKKYEEEVLDDSARSILFGKTKGGGFNTPSGKVELLSSISRDAGEDPLPYYRENQETPFSTPEIAKDYPLVLTTGHRHVAYFHSSNRQVPWCRELEPYPRVQIHPDTAAGLDIRDGDWVWIEAPKERGRVRMKAEVTEAVDPRVVAAPSHWWYPENKEDPLHGVFESNINVIISNDPPYEGVTGAVTLRGGLCKVYREEEL
ncbi:MAG: molybdopterin-dependent oxidoreductase [Deltaproteobacteria bacterium]|nr:molybdopterin-dependent oxidoreductase [Deltaproteobacteria bacterium]